MNKLRIFKASLLMSLLALSQVMYGEETYTLYEWDFANGFGEWEPSYDVDMVYEEDESLKNLTLWVYDNELKCVKASYSNSSIMETQLISPEIELPSDKYYYDYNISIEYATLNFNYEWAAYANLVGNSGSTITLNSTPANTFRTVSSSIDVSKGNKFNIWLVYDAYYSNKYTGALYIKSVKITAKHLFDRHPFVDVHSIKEIKELADNTPVRLTQDRVVLLEGNMQTYFIRDDEAAIRATNIIDYFGWPGTVMTDTILGMYSKIDGIPTINHVFTTANYEECGYVSIAPVEIEEDDYWNHISELVTMPLTEKICVDDFFEYRNGNMWWYEPHNPSTKVSGIVYPMPNGKKRMLYSSCGKPTIELDLFDNVPVTFTEQDIYTCCVIHRSFQKDKWYSIIIPQSLNTMNCELAEFVSSSDGVLNFNIVKQGQAGKPYLIKFKEDVDSIYCGVAVDNSELSVVEGSDYNFVGTYSPVQPKDGSYYLSANNTIRPLAHGGTIKGFRAYFEPNTPSAAPARAISIDGVVTAIGDFPLADDLFAPTGKVYTVSGQYVGDNLEALPKGMYIVNGKKVIK